MHRPPWYSVQRAISLSSTPRQLIALLPGRGWPRLQHERPKAPTSEPSYKPGTSGKVSAFLVQTAVIALACLCPLAALLALLFLHVLCPSPSSKV